MTTYRRFCCNDLLRFGHVNISALTQTHITDIYMCHMAQWPGNCIVADEPGGRITGYIFGSVEGTGKECTGELSIITVASRDMMDLAKKLSNMLDDSCDKIYKAYTMKVSIPTDNSETKSIADKLGYILYHVEPEKFEMRKPLSGLLKMAFEYKRNEYIRRDIIKILGIEDLQRS